MRRRHLLGILSGAAVPVVARAQVAPVAPQVIPPTSPPSITAPPPPAPTAPSVPRPPVTAAAVDKTKSYYVFFEGMIDAASARRLRQQLANLVEGGVEDIILVIDSSGGQLDPTLTTYGFIRALPAKIKTHAQGFVQSAATLLFLAGQDRSADRSARFVFHPSQSVVLPGVAGEEQVRERVTSFAMVLDVMAQVYRDRTHIPEPEIERFTREMVVYTAEQAQGFGVIQTVADLQIQGDGKSKIVLLE